MSKRSRYYLAKSADTGKCGNKPGLPSTVGVSLSQRRVFKGGLNNGGCCKTEAPEGCTGPADRRPISVKTQETVLSTTFDYNNSVITVTLSVGKVDDAGKAAALVAGDFTVVAPTAATAGLVFQNGSGNAAGTTANFGIGIGSPGAVGAVVPNTLAPGASFDITLNDGVKSKNAKTLKGTSISTQVVSSTKIKILAVNDTYAIVQFSSNVSNAANAQLASTDFVITGAKTDGTNPTATGVVAAFDAASGFIGDQVGGNTYKLLWQTPPTPGEVVTITPNVIHETSNGVKITADNGGVLGKAYPDATTATATTDNPRIVA